MYLSRTGMFAPFIPGFRDPLPGIDWLIVGGESGPDARPFDIAWARSAIAQCKAAGVACFVKQLGAHPFDGYDLAGDGNSDSRNTVEQWLRLRDRKGGDLAEWPEDLRVREFPASSIPAPDSVQRGLR
jgi:hypothetical protein